MDKYKVLKKHNDYVQARRQRIQKLKQNAYCEQPNVNNVEPNNEVLGNRDAQLEVDIEVIDNLDVSLDNIAKLFGRPKTATESDDVINRQLKWIDERESRIKEILKKQEDELNQSLNFTPNVGDGQSSWTWAKKESEKEQEKVLQKEKERELKREQYRIQEELLAQALYGNGMLSPIDEIMMKAESKKQKKKKKKVVVDDVDVMLNNFNSDLQEYENRTASQSSTSKIINNFSTSTHDMVRSMSADNHQQEEPPRHKFVALDPTISPYKSKPKKVVKKPVVIEPPDEFTIDFKALNKVSSIQNITQKDISDAQNWFAKLMRERKDIDNNHDDYVQPELPSAPVIMKKKKVQLNSLATKSALATSLTDHEKAKDNRDTIKSATNIVERPAHRDFASLPETKNDNVVEHMTEANTFFHESSTEEKGRHNIHEPLSFDSSSISRRVDSQNSNVSYLTGHRNDSGTTPNSYEIITIVFDKRYFNESSAQKWWAANEIRARKEVEIKVK